MFVSLEIYDGGLVTFGDGKKVKLLVVAPFVHPVFLNCVMCCMLKV